MTHFKKKLQFSASLVALMCGGGLLSTAARAVTITGTQASIFIGSDVVGDVVVAGTGIISPDGMLVSANVGADLINNGTVKALASGSSPGGSISVVALEVNTGTVGGDFLNTGTIQAQATNSAASTATSADNSNYADATAIGVDINSLTGDFTNTGTVSAVASADLAYQVGTVATPATTAAVSDSAYAYAGGVLVYDAGGTVTNGVGHSITASATATADFQMDVEDYYVSAHLDHGTASATATGLYVDSGTHDVVNAGSISATASAVETVGINAVATTETADVDVYAYVNAEAYGADINGTTTGFDNSGTITATAAASLTDTVTADGATSAVVYLYHTVSATATGVYVRDLQGDFTNSGAISAVATADLAATASATDASSWASVSLTNTANAYAAGVGINYLDGTFTNASTGTITASATAAASYDLSAVGPTAAIYVTSVELTVTASGIYLDGEDYAVGNSGTITADASASLAVGAVVTATSSTAEIDMVASVSAEAHGAELNGTTTGFDNSGTIAATVSASVAETLTADGQTSALIYLDNYVNADATAVRIDNLQGDFTNTGTISGTSSVNVAVTASATDADSYALVGNDGSEDRIEAYANGVGMGGLEGTFTNAADAVISASAAASARYDLSAVGPEATASQDIYRVTADATGYYNNSGTNDFVNAGTISADATASFNVSAVAAATTGEAYVQVDGDWVGAWGYAAWIGGTTTSFDNSGTFTATANAASVEDLTANGVTGASIAITNEVEASAWGPWVNNLDGDYKNSGTISATASASLAVKAVATDVSSSANIYVYDDLWAGAWGATFDDVNGTITNETGATISAAASHVASYDLTATGPLVSISARSITQSVSAFGLEVRYGGEFDIVNSGTISASAAAALTITASAVGTTANGSVYLNDVDQTVSAYGVYASPYNVSNVTGLNNSGTISATASASLVENVTASGETTASVTIDNDVSVKAIGVYFDDPTSGDIDNSGTISATASATIDVTASASVGADAGNVFVSTQARVLAIGVSAEFTTPETGPLHSFTNSGNLTASGTLSITNNYEIAAASQTVVSTLGTSASVTATGAVLWGGLGTVVNTGTISATVAAQNVANAVAVGLALPDAAAGLQITNSGTIKADITGSADSSLAIALAIGPETAPTTTSQSETAAGVITVTNSGTISATNETGVSVGIGGLTAPAPLVINQQGGSISGEIAIELDQGNADILNWTGGAIHGIVSADEVDVVNVFSGTGTPASNTVTADADFALVGGAALNIGQDDKAVTFSMAGTTTGTGEVNLNKNASLVMQTSGSIGAGTFNMDPATTLTFIFNPTDAGEIVTTGDANIDGVLNAVALPGLYGDKGSHVVIASAGDVVGTFDNTSINGDTLLLDFTATVHPQDVTISWKRNAFNAVPGLTINSTSVATALEEGYDPTRAASKNTPELNDILSAMFTLKDGARYDRVLNSWSGSEHAQVMHAAANLSEPYHMALSEHLNDIRHTGGADGQVVMLRPKGSSNSIAPLSAAGASGADESKFEFWGRAFGRWASTRGDVEATGFDEDTFGAVLGGDFRVSQNLTIGLVTGYMDDKLKFDDGDLGKIKRWTIGGYLSATFNQFYIDGSLTYASDNYKVNRTIQYGNTSCLAFTCTTGAASKYDGNGMMGHAEVGYLFELGDGAALRPFAGLNYSSVDADPFSETGGGDLGLDVLDGTGKSFQSRLGARLSGAWGDGSTKWIPELRAEWRHEFKDNPSWIVANLNGLPNDPFTAIGSKVTQDLAVVGAGVTALMSNGVGVFFDYQGAFGSGYHSHAIQGGVRVKF